VDASFNEEKAFRFLVDIKTDFTKIYKGNLPFILKQTNLTPNCFDKMFKQNFQKIIDNYNTGISSKNLQQAFKKVDELKDIAARSVTKMA
jgi:hypothetical protein